VLALNQSFASIEADIRDGRIDVETPDYESSMPIIRLCEGVKTDMESDALGQVHRMYA
jgi:hypothetical protein